MSGGTKFSTGVVEEVGNADMTKITECRVNDFQFGIISQNQFLFGQIQTKFLPDGCFLYFCFRYIEANFLNFEVCFKPRIEGSSMCFLMNWRQGLAAARRLREAAFAADRGDLGEYLRAHFFAHLLEQRVTAAFLPAARRLALFRGDLLRDLLRLALFRGDLLRLLFRGDLLRDLLRLALFRELRRFFEPDRLLDLLLRDRFWDFDFAI